MSDTEQELELGLSFRQEYEGVLVIPEFKCRTNFQESQESV